jgi:hypothetical protein
MSASQYRRQLDAKRKQRADAERKAAQNRSKETTKRTAAAKARADMAKAKSSSSSASKAREAERAEREAASAGKEAASWQQKAVRFGKEEADLQSKLAKAERSEADTADRKRVREEQQRDRRLAAERASLEARLSQTEHEVRSVARVLRPPKPEKLRVLLLGASSGGDLRIGREQQRIRAAVQSALHRDLVDLDVRPAATTNDLLDGITGFRPHVVHFSGHSDHNVIEFEHDLDTHHDGLVVAAAAFASTLTATDDPPLLVLLNSCNSASQIDRLVTAVVPFAIGMTSEIDDSDAIAYAAQFYAAVTNAQSIQSAHLSARAALELGGLPGAELPRLAWASDVDPSTAILVAPPPD